MSRALYAEVTSESILRILLRDSERTFIPKDDPVVQARARYGAGVDADSAGVGKVSIARCGRVQFPSFPRSEDSSPHFQARTLARQQTHQRNLKIAIAEINDYHQGLGPAGSLGKQGGKGCVGRATK